MEGRRACKDCKRLNKYSASIDRRCYKIWHKTKTASDQNKYKEARRNARRSVALAQEKTRQELVNEFESTAGK